MKTAQYRMLDGSVRTIEYDENALCVSCDLPVVTASVGGTRLCPWCDMGIFRDKSEWAFRDCVDAEYRKRRAKQKTCGVAGHLWMGSKSAECDDFCIRCGDERGTKP